ncbi:MAG: WYL domain-containing protein [Planctomycetota bacterium]
MDPSSTGQVKVSKTERLLNLISFMLRSRRPIPFSKIAGHVVGYDDEARLDSIEKRFDRDKAELRNMGIPVEYIDGGSPEASGYIIPLDRFFLGEIKLDTVDAVILSMAGRSGAVAMSSPIMKEAFASALRKLAVDAPEIGEVPAERASLLQVSSGHAKVAELLQTICAAVYSRRTIRFSYRGRQDTDPQKRRVDPYGLGIDRGEWYLVGFDHDREGTRMFRLSRVVGAVALTGASDASFEFEVPKGFRIEDHLFREAWDFGDVDPTEVKIRVPRDLALQLRHQSRLHFKFVDASEDDDEAQSSTLVLSAKAPEKMADWLLSLGPDVEILEPKSIRKVMKDHVARHAAHYQAELRT